MSLKIGRKAPDFKAKDTNGNDIRLISFIGEKNVLLVFYPLDFSPVCSKQLPAYSARVADFESRDTQIVAVSRDSSFSHKAFCDFVGGLEFPLLSDMDLSMAEAYGVKFGTSISNRAEFLIDKDGVLRWANVEDSPGEDTISVDEILAEISKLQNQITVKEDQQWGH